MIQTFDVYDLYEMPTFLLTNPDKTELFALGGIRDRKYSPRFNSLSEVSFTAPYQISGSPTEYYDYLTYRRLIYLKNAGYFMITTIREINDGILREKEIIAQSLEVEMSGKNISDISATYKFYDPFSTSASPTLMDTVLGYVPGWTIGTVDLSIAGLYRTFNITSSTIYNFLMQDVEQAYQCVFDFDSINKTISAYSVLTFGTTTDISISYNNLIDTLNLEEVTDELVTSLTVLGAGDLSINTVNPLGTNVIYNYDYFKTTNWMSQALIDAINNWESLIAINQPIYADLLTQLKDKNSLLLTQNSQLVTLQGQFLALDDVRNVRIQANQNYDDINALMAAKQVEIDSKTAEIASTQSSISNIQSQLLAINNLLSFNSNFTPSEIELLSSFTIENSYVNDNFLQTDTMTNVQIQDQAQQLYDQGIEVLNKVSQPRYIITMDAVNYILLKDYLVFTNQTIMGATFNLEISDRRHITPVLLGLDINYDNPLDFKMLFSNRLRLDDGSFQYSDLISDSVKTTSTTKVNSTLWTSRGNYVQDTVSVFLNSSLDASKNAVISGSNQQIVINQNGFTGRQYDPLTSTYSPEQVKIINNVLAFTKDNWATASVALGKFTNSSGSFWGVIGDVICGKILASNQLTVTNKGNNFTLDASGATLTNASFTLNTTNGNSKILLDPTVGIKVQANVGGTWTDRFAVDNTGNVNFSGNLTGATGTFSGAVNATSGNIGGLSITTSRIQYDSNNYISSDGTLKWGPLSIQGGNATFAGNIYANNLQGQIVDSQIATMNANKVTAGTLSGMYISWPGAHLSNTGTGFAEIRGDSGVGIYSGGHGLETRNNGVSVTDLTIASGAGNFNCLGRAYFTGGITAGGNQGLTGSIDVRAYSGQGMQIFFYSGIFYYYQLH